MNQTKQPTPTPTPGPWRVKTEYIPHEDRTATVLYGRRQAVHAIGQPWLDEGIGELYCDADAPDAAHIVRCVNAHAELVQALEDIKEALEPPGVINTTWLKEHVSKALATLPQGEGKAHA